MEQLQPRGQVPGVLAQELATVSRRVDDSARFLKAAFDELLALVGRYRAALHLLAPEYPELAAEMADAEEAADLRRNVREVPRAFAMLLDGVERITGTLGKEGTARGGPHSGGR